MGQKLTVRTTEPEETLQRNIDRVKEALDRIQAHTGAVDTVRLFALGLLHLGRELNVLEHRYNVMAGEIQAQLDGWMQQVQSSVASS